MLIKVIKHILSIIKFTKNICFELIEIDARKVKYFIYILIFRVSIKN